jgi:hypothetical protein
MRKGVVLLAVMATVAWMAVAAQPALATNANVWVIVSDSHCGFGGKIAGFQGISASPNFPYNGYSWGAVLDWGDNIIYPWVTLGIPYHLAGWARCTYWWRTPRDINVTYGFTPSYRGQNIWV